MKSSYKLSLVYPLIGLILGLFLQACPGPDTMPDYFGNGETAPTPAVSETPPASGSCTVNLKAALCVIIKGDNIEAGVEDPLCVEEIPPIPFEIKSGTGISLHGETFPDIEVAGHGLTVPIIINAKGSTNGSDNVGTGTIDASGNIEITNFNFYITALGMVGQIPSLTLTTGSTEELTSLSAISGSPVSTDGSVTMVLGTVLGHLFPAADEKLFGASLEGTFTGKFEPPPSGCKGEEGPQNIMVTKLITDEAGKQIEEQIPNKNRMEIGKKTFIAMNPSDIGPRFSNNAKFKIANVSEESIQINLPPRIGPFIISSIGSLIKKLAPKESLIVTVTFYPTIDTVDKPGEIDVPLTIGTDTFHLIGTAIEATGQVAIDLLDNGGKTVLENIQGIDLGLVQVPASSKKQFFECQQITCNGGELPTKCQPCVDITSGRCQLLTIDISEKPTDEVDANCNPLIQKPTETMAINLAGTQSVPILPTRKVIQIRNTGPIPLTINTIDISDVPGSSSKGQFVVKTNAIFHSNDFSSIQTNIREALEKGDMQGDALPIVLDPYDPPNSEDKVFVVISYEPNDLIGFDGLQATIGNVVTDKGTLRIASTGIGSSLALTGTTAIKDIPALQVYFKTTTGVKDRADGQTMPFRDVTAETVDSAIPLFIKISESADHPLLIKEIKLSGPDASFFEWLDTKDKINAKPSGSRCTIPVMSPDSSGQSGIIADLSPVTLGTNGYTLRPSEYTLDTMPLFGCINYHRDTASLTPEQIKKRQFSAIITIKVQELKTNGEPAKNPDGSIKESTFTIKLLSVINPLKGHLVFRITQTIASLMNPQFPSVSAAAAKSEIDMQIAEGRATEADRFVFLGAMVLDPFDEETIKDEDGTVVSTPGDGITAVFRPVDTHPVKETYEDPLAEYTSLIHNSLLPEGQRGIFFDYPNLPEGFKTSGLKIYTGSLSYPGPLALPEDKPEEPSQCEMVDPCSIEGQRKLGQGNPNSGKTGVCAFFFVTAGTYDSPSFHYPEEIGSGTRKNMCDYGNEHQNLNSIKGIYNLDGLMHFENVGLGFWGPTYFHNPFGPLGPAAPLNEIFKMSFTTGVLLPPSETPGLDLLPDKRIDIGRSEYKMNLNDNNLTTAQLCGNNTKNRYIQGNYYSTWKYLKPFLVKDETGETPAGCPEPGLSYTGGSAYLRGTLLNHETGVAAFATESKFSSSENLTFAFKDVMLFVILNGWFCDPLGPEEEMEGSHCYDLKFNDRDALPQVSILGD